MLRSKPSRLSRLLLVGLVAVVLLAAAGCASDDDSSAPPPATTAASQPAAAAGADRLDAGDAETLRAIRQTVARYCAGHKATAGELTGAIATLESLYTIDPNASQSDGTTVEQSATTLQQKLRACGARTAAKRLGRLTR
ncbi:MAG TPA: hypothetical protein VLK59_15335 [Solirubrobacteraceae bacterium]|nr:hypothetical protein [Solirubrobacteraceae bacterium]